MNTKLLPLALLEANETEPIEGITRFMKVVFLAQEETLSEEFYEYEAGQYGPYSKSLYDDIDRLEARGFIERTNRETAGDQDDEQVYTLTQKGKRTLEQAQKLPNDCTETVEDISEVKSQYNSMDLWELLEYVYAEYPEMAKNSVLDIATGKAA